jgi:outer membrane protein insertion porin family
MEKQENKFQMKNSLYIIIYILCFLSIPANAQYISRDTNVNIDYSRTPRQVVVKSITVEGIPNYDQNMLARLSGINVGEHITIPGEDITKAIKRYWKNGLFSNVAISVDSIVNDSAYLHIQLSPRPRISKINYNGIKKSERDDLKDKLGLVVDNQLTPNMIDRAKILGKRYFEDKGFNNAEIEILQQDDPSAPDKVIVDINVKKNAKVIIRKINIYGNTVISERKLHGYIFNLKKGVLRTISQKKGFHNLFRSHKFVESKYKEAKENLQNYYAELGYRDAIIVADTVKSVSDKYVDINIRVEEGEKYYIRNIEWVGNTVYKTEYLDALLNMKKGDVYNQKLLAKRLTSDDDAVGNLYYNNGYVFYQLDPVEINIVDDSVDLEMRINEGPQARISRVKITGNDRVYENVVRRELRNKPGDLFSKEALERSFREIGSMGHFNPENINWNIEPDPSSGTVDLGWGLESKSNDQIEFSLGYGQTGVIGKIGLKFANFCLANLFKKGGIRRGVIPQGNGETFSISGQTNGSYYQQYSIQYVNPWFGGKRPNTFSFSAFYSKQTDVSDRYYNSAYYDNYYNNMYGGGYGYGYGYGNYENYYDPDKYQQVFGVSIGWGKRLRWPDDYFMFSTELSYTRYMMKDWNYFSLMTNGNCNNLAIRLSLSRNSTDNQIYPRRGSEVQLSVAFTPPYSLWDGKDYANLANDVKSSTYAKELQEKYSWIEYHKWKFKARTFTALSGHNKCFVLMTRAEIGLLGSYNKHKPSPFENYYMGGDGTSGYSSYYSTETIGLRGYDNGSLTPGGNMGYAYTRFTVELRYPFMLGASTNVFGLIFAEGGNCWSDISNFNPFDLKKSVGVGARIFLPMVGLLGIDWAYGFDKVQGVNTYSGSHFHFVLGQEF